MKYLLDTHLLVWTTSDSRRLSKRMRLLLDDPQHELYFSSASIWEVAIKYALGRPHFNIDPAALLRGLLDHGYIELPITSAHSLSLRMMPPLHKDPFDRILVAQALTEGITLLTVDPLVASYPGPIKQI